MSKKPTRERRSAVRFSLIHQGIIEGPRGGELSVVTQSLSRSGAYLSSSHHPTFSLGAKIGLRLCPDPASGRELPTISGRVVRLEHLPEKEYGLAVEFSKLIADSLWGELTLGPGADSADSEECLAEAGAIFKLQLLIDRHEVHVNYCEAKEGEGKNRVEKIVRLVPFVSIPDMFSFASRIQSLFPQVNVRVRS